MDEPTRLQFLMRRETELGREMARYSLGQPERAQLSIERKRVRLQIDEIMRREAMADRKQTRPMRSQQNRGA